MLVATAHDVLEDWAILQWLEEQHLTSAGSFKALSDSIGTHPAIRRSFRKRVAELVERDAAAADRSFQAAVTETEISVPVSRRHARCRCSRRRQPQLSSRATRPQLLDK